MTKVMWLGEDTEDVPGPSFNVWNNIKFPKDKWVEVTDPHMLMKARKNHFYKVIEDEPDEAKGPLSEKEMLEQFERQKTYDAKQEVLRKQEADQFDTSGTREPKQETHHAQGKALERKAQELKSKIENKKEAHDYRKTEKGSGYTPLKKRLKKEKAAGRAGVSAPHARSDSTDTDAA